MFCFSFVTTINFIYGADTDNQPSLKWLEILQMFKHYRYILLLAINNQIICKVLTVVYDIQFSFLRPLPLTRDDKKTKV